MKIIYLILFALIVLTSCSPKESATVESPPEITAQAEAAFAVPLPEKEEIFEIEANEEASEEPEEETVAEKILAGMSMEEKLGQLFICAFRKDASGRAHTGMNPQAEEAVGDYYIGGVVFFRENIVSEEQTREYISDLQGASEIPLFIGIDEEGGMVRRTQSLNVASVGSQFNIAKKGESAVYEASQIIADYIKPMGFNLNFAPVADVFSNPANTVIAERAFGSDEKTVSTMVPLAVAAYNEAGIISVLKHFPGHGDTLEDSHYGSAFTQKTLDEIRETELRPFAAGIEAGAPMVMVGHIAAPQINGNNEPAVFSHKLVAEILRGEMGFGGVIITDAMDMGALDSYGAAESAVKAFEAGIDILLMPSDYKAAYAGLRQALATGRITQAQLDAKVLRILECKEKFMGLNY